MSVLALPSTREEAWRWSDLAALPELAEARPTPRSRPLRPLPWLESAPEGPRLLFVDGRFVAEQSDLGRVRFEPVEPLGHPLARLIGRDGWTLTVGSGDRAPGLAQIVHVSTGGADHLPGRIALGQGAEASVVETFVGEGWANRLTRIDLAEGANLKLARRILSESGFVSLTDRATVAAGARLAVTTLAAGGADTRLDGEIDLAGAGAFAEAGGALLGRGRQRHDANLVVRHVAPGGTSRQVWRSVADDKAICAVAARVEVARDAQKSDGEQSVKGLLLSRTATINAKPELEIFADDVKCAHGATVGELDRAALFYLASRGVPPVEAKGLLTRAFVADAIERIGDQAVREAFRADAMKWLG
jgi:Fe-S cluster assembly protein SufD